MSGVFKAITGRTGDARLVEACLDGDQRAWDMLIGKYERLIYSIPRKYGAPPEDAADIFQAVCLELFNELPRLRNKDNLKAWLATVTFHKAFHWKRRGARRLEATARDGEVLERASMPPEMGRQLELEQLVREAIGRLPSRCRSLVEMLFYEHPTTPYTEIARRLGVARGSIGFIRGRCLRQLQRHLEDVGL
jgi:RNA polymerase sigma factor (sigma-70 family)